jgi:hypothetical protein
MQTRFLKTIVATCALALTAHAHAGPAEELAAFSLFKNVDTSKLAKGDVVAMRGPSVAFPRAASSQACYVVNAPVQKTVELHERWTPMKHPELKVWLHVDFTGKPSADVFKKADAAPDNSSVRSLASATESLNADQPQLQMTRAEAKLFSKGAKGLQSAAWANLLQQRTAAFLSGGLAHEPPYEVGGENIRVSDEAAQLLKEQPKIAAQFSALADKLANSPSSPQLYWELSDVEGQAGFSLGAVLKKQSGTGWQMVDAQYYKSGGYYVLLTFYQMWPVQIDGHDATLVWRGDFVSSATLGELHGVERVASGTALMREVKKTIGIFLKDVSN